MSIVASAPSQCIGGGGSVRCQEGWLRAEGGAVGTPGVVAVEFLRHRRDETNGTMAAVAAAAAAVVGAGGAETAETTMSVAAALDTARAVCRALDASGRAVICAEVLVRPNVATQVWCLWWPQNCVGGDESDESDDTAARPLGDLHSHLNDAWSAMSPL
jgi:hypothetical protein